MTLDVASRVGGIAAAGVCWRRFCIFRWDVGGENDLSGQRCDFVAQATGRG